MRVNEACNIIQLCDGICACIGRTASRSGLLLVVMMVLILEETQRSIA
jgi:hypothetical protein